MWVTTRLAPLAKSCRRSAAENSFELPVNAVKVIEWHWRSQWHPSGRPIAIVPHTIRLTSASCHCLCELPGNLVEIL
jgi:hypothetical protein